MLVRKTIIGLIKRSHFIYSSISDHSLYWAKATDHSNKLFFVGVTDKYLDQNILGTVDVISLDSKQNFLFDWSSLKYSDGDELYHTVWTNVEGKSSIKLDEIFTEPQKVFLRECNFSLIESPSKFTNECWLFKVEAV